MALGNMFTGMGSFFDGWKAMNEIVDAHTKMLATATKREGYNTAADLSDAQERAREAVKNTPFLAEDLAAASGSSVPTEIKEAIAPPEAVSPSRGDPNLWEQIKPYIKKYEGMDSYTVGFGGVDISKYPAKPGYFGFPDWPGGTDPGSGRPTHAAGFAQFQPDTWKRYAPIAGVSDFSPASQEKVAYQAYLAEGLRPWVPYNPVLKSELAKAGLLGGLPTAAARRGEVPATSDLEGQRGRAASPVASTTPSALGTPAASAARPAVPPAVGPTVATATIPESAMTVSHAPAPMPPPISVGLPDIRTLTGAARQPVPGPGAGVVGSGYAGPARGAPAATPAQLGAAGAAAQRANAARGGSGGGTPAMPGPGAGGNPYNTQLPPTQEAAFRAWVKNNKVKFNPDADMTDYDMRGFWGAQQQGDPRAQTTYNPDANEVHYPDVWKTPIHKSFSNESQYAPPGAPHWEGKRLIGNDGNVLFEDSALGR